MAYKSIANEFTGPPGGKTVTVFAIKLDSNFNASAGAGLIGPTESPSIPSQFHEALVCRVLEKLYAQNPATIQVASYWGQKFAGYIVEGKRYATVGRDGGRAKIKPMEY
jgi:hypothetical protein